MINEKLAFFLENNEHVELTQEGNDFTINKPWGFQDCRLTFSEDNSQIIDDLNSVILNPRLDAIIHTDLCLIEFAFIFIHNQSPYHEIIANRRFELILKKESIKCYFAKPTDRFYNIAKGYHQMPSEGVLHSMPQLLAFRDYCNQENISDRNKNFFIDKNPYNFFIELPKAIIEFDIIKLCHQVNFVMQTYDRNTPEIQIRDLQENNVIDLKQVQYIKNKFPDKIILRDYDDTLLKLVKVATESNSRQAVLYYYQVFEYTGYYYTDLKTKQSLLKILKDPCILSSCEDNLGVFLDLLTEINNANNNDEVKIRRVIEDKCNPEEIWVEIENDKKFFSEEHVFDGGYVSQKLISNECDYENWLAMWHPKLIDHLTKIRNCIVHARERRENKVILPTIKNNEILIHYVPIMERMARQIINMIS